MTRQPRIMLVCAAAASAFCVVAGLWILSFTGFDSQDNALATAIGLYFIGKGCFVGPMLWTVAERRRRSSGIEAGGQAAVQRVA
jgi:uncharacterized membrane protein